LLRMKPLTIISLSLLYISSSNMPRFFDDYSNTYLTHDSAAGRKQQRRGWKFRENFKLVRVLFVS
jgi:hypothetical protein